MPVYLVFCIMIILLHWKGMNGQHSIIIARDKRHLEFVSIVWLT